MMRNILMLDLDGVLLACGRIKKPGVRPFAHKFLKYTLPLFDESYLNTCVDEKTALKIMKDLFDVDIGYHKWNKRIGKHDGYEKFKDSKIIHVEDGSIDDKEAKEIISMGHIYIPVKGWYPHHAFKERKIDDKLMITLDHIKYHLNKS